MDLLACVRRLVGRDPRAHRARAQARRGRDQISSSHKLMTTMRERVQVLVGGTVGGEGSLPGRNSLAGAAGVGARQRELEAAGAMVELAAWAVGGSSPRPGDDDWLNSMEAEAPSQSGALGLRERALENARACRALARQFINCSLIIKLYELPWRCWRRPEWLLLLGLGGTRKPARASPMRAPAKT